MCKNRSFVKLIDFGFAKFCRQSSVTSSDHHLSMTETKGTPCYMSPEVLKGKYDKRCDLWSIGVITFYLLAGKLPFRANTEEQLNTLIKSTDYDFEERDWAGLSLQSKQFIRGLIEPNVQTRMTCDQALAHPWIQNNKPQLTEEQKADIAEIFMRLKNFKRLNRFKMALMLIFRRHIAEERVLKNLDAFHVIDTDNSGYLNNNGMQCAMQELCNMIGERNFTAEDIDATFAKLDLDNTGLITYSQFLMATVDPEILNDETLLLRHFNELDSLQEGFLTKESIKVTLQREGVKLSDEYIEEIFQQHLGFKPGQKINFATFKEIFIRIN